MEQLPKLVFSDIGGTLIRNTSRIPDFTGTTFSKLINRNIPVILLTGFNYHTTRELVQGHDPELILMPQNGTICIKNNTIIWEHQIEAKAILELYRFLDEQNLPIIVYKGIMDDFKVLYKGRGKMSRPYPFVEIDDMLDFNNVTGISTIVDDSQVDRIGQEIYKIIENRFLLIRGQNSGNNWLEVTPRSVRKDLAAKRYCEENQIDLSDVIFFGDNYNDLELLRIVGYPVIVENAISDLKTEFTNIADSVDREGVATYLQNLYNL